MNKMNKTSLIIARVFKKMNLIERWGTGVGRIIEECKEQQFMTHCMLQGL